MAFFAFKLLIAFYILAAILIIWLYLKNADNPDNVEE